MNDLAVVRVDGATGVVALPFTNELPATGAAVYAIGHPAQNLWSVTRGLVGAVRPGVVQHDAAINSGNSGGPLLDGQGRVVGVNTLTMTGEVKGISYARPVALARPLVGAVVAPLVLAGVARRRRGECERAREIAVDAWEECIDWAALALAILLVDSIVLRMLVNDDADGLHRDHAHEAAFLRALEERLQRLAPVGG